MGVKGADVSHWNSPSDVIRRIKDDDLRFLIIKATEGSNFKDPKADFYNRICEKYNVMPGFYHYARPEKNTNPRLEAHHFVTVVEEIVGKISDANDGILLALDWEGESLNQDYKWAIEWCDNVKEFTGINPMIYTGFYYVKNFKGLYSQGGTYDFGLWCARWNNKPLQGVTSVDPWKFTAIHQYTSSSGIFDYDMFNGTEEQLHLYGKSALTVGKEDETRPCQCGCCDLDGVPTN